MMLPRRPSEPVGDAPEKSRRTKLAVGVLLFDTATGTLAAPDGAEISLRPKPAEVLRNLAERAGEVVTREALIDAVWPGIFVTDDSLTQCIAEIRRALGDDGALLLRTLPKRGYMLVAARLAGAAPPPEPPPAIRSPAGIPVLAMLPLRLPQGCEPELVAFADILLDGIVGALATLREPVVISANSTRHLAGTTEDVAALALRFGADYLAFGSLQRLGRRVRLSVELAEAARGALVWHRVHDLPADGLFDAPDELAVAIAHTLVPRLRNAELRTSLRQRQDVDAYHLLLSAQALMFKLDRATFDEAGAMLRRAAALDPGFAAPHFALANWHSLRIGQRWSADPAAEARALEVEVGQALALDGGHARALALLGHSRTILHRDYDRAQDLLDRALDRAPNDAETWLWTSPTLAYTGRVTDAVRHAQRAIRLSPEDPLLFRYQHFLSIAYYACGQWEEAAHWGLRSMWSNGDYTSNLATTAAALAALGRREEARAPVARMLELLPGYRVSMTMASHAYRDDATREQYGQHLIAAGLPA